MELVKEDRHAREAHFVRGEPYMAFIKVIPYYEQGNPTPVMLRFNEMIRRDKPREEKYEFSELKSEVGDKEWI